MRLSLVPVDFYKRDGTFLRPTTPEITVDKREECGYFYILVGMKIRWKTNKDLTPLSGC